MGGKVQVENLSHPVGHLEVGLPALHDGRLSHEHLADGLGDFLAGHGPGPRVLAKHLAGGHMLQIRGHGRVRTWREQD